jgi:hypothetical protein
MNSRSIVYCGLNRDRGLNTGPPVEALREQPLQCPQLLEIPYVTCSEASPRRAFVFTVFRTFPSREMKTNLMRYSYSVYFVSQPLHVSGIFVAHHQEVYCIYTAVGTCYVYQLTVCWKAVQQTVN